MKKLIEIAIVITIFSISTAAFAQKKQSKPQAKKQTTQQSAAVSQPNKQPISSYGYSQSSHSKLTLGGRIGLTFSDFVGQDKDALDYKMATGLSLGVEGNFWFTQDLGVSAQILYVSKTAKADRNLGGAKVAQTLNTSYLELPIYAKYRTGSGTTSPYFFAGPAIGFLLANKASLAHGADKIDAEIEGWSSTEFALNLGAGVSHQLNSTMQLVFDATYSIGLSDLNDEGSDLVVNHRGIRLMGGVQIAIR